MKKLVLALAVLLAVSTAGCGTASSGKTSGSASGSASKSTAAASSQTASSAAAFTGKYVTDASYVKNHLSDIILVDARGEETAAKGTVKGAIALTWQYLATCEDGATGDANWGCILDTARLSERLGEMGLSKDKEIVLFSSNQDGWGEDGRIAWELLAAGYTKVKIVDGGYPALKAAGIETQNGASKPTPTTVSVSSVDMTHDINTDELKDNYDQYKVVDVRSDKEYDGDTAYGEAKGGHLPGAIHIRYTDLFNTDGTLKSNAELTKLFTDAGLSKNDKIVTYCTAGIRSAYMQLVMEMCGFENVKNYDESYYRWCAVQEVEK